MATKRLSVPNPGEVGIIRDVAPSLLPPAAWTDGNNIRFINNEVRKMLGNTEIHAPTLTDVQFIMPATKWTSGVSEKIWLYAGLDHVYYSNNGSSDSKITRVDGTPADVVYTGDTNDRWHGCVNQNVIVINNGKDAPQAFAQNATKLKDLRWDSSNTWDDAGWSTKTIRSHKNFLFALQLDKGDGYGMNPNSVAWSEPAEPWAEPTTWDASDVSSIAGQIELASSEGQIIDGLTLKDNFIIYKDTSIYNLSYTGGQYIWQSRDVSKNIGLLAQGAVVEVLGQHVFMTNDDILVTDGYQFKSVANQKVRTKIFSEMDSTLFNRSFAVANYAKEEVWFCYATTNSTYINRAAVWNYTSSTWTFKDLPNVNFLNYGVLYDLTNPGNAWSDDTENWSDDSTVWDEGTITQVVQRLLGATDSSIRLFDSGYTCNTTSYESYVERTGIKLDDSSTMKRITAVYPKGVGNVDVYVGYTMHQNDPYTWEGPFNITPEEDAQIRCRVTGRYHGIRFVFKGDTEHKLLSYDIEYVDTGYGR